VLGRVISLTPPPGFAELPSPWRLPATSLQVAGHGTRGIVVLGLRICRAPLATPAECRRRPADLLRHGRATSSRPLPQGLGKSRDARFVRLANVCAATPHYAETLACGTPTSSPRDS
jgi:hypothetical protein